MVNGQQEDLPPVPGGDGMLEPYIEFSLSLEGQAPKFDKDGVKIQRGTGYGRIPCRRR